MLEFLYVSSGVEDVVAKQFGRMYADRPSVAGNVNSHFLLF
jgi:hypothetical protein